jgi:hypothetical protein
VNVYISCTKFSTISNLAGLWTLCIQPISLEGYSGILVSGYPAKVPPRTVAVYEGAVLFLIYICLFFIAIGFANLLLETIY